jgi:hypothetical protein
MTQSAIALNAGTVLDRQGEKTEWPAHPEDLSIPTWDSGGKSPGIHFDLKAEERSLSIHQRAGQVGDSTRKDCRHDC